MATAAASISKALARRMLGGRPIHLAPVTWESHHLLPPLYFSTIASAISSLPQPPASPSSHNQEEQSAIWSKLFLFVPGAITFGLGTWQIFRREEKIKMLEYRQNRLVMEPIRCTNISPNDSIDSLEFRRLICKGTFDEKNSIYVGPRSRSISGVTENGYYLITPLVPIPGNPECVQRPILVNRGWVPRNWRDRSRENPQYCEQPSNLTSTSARVTSKNPWWKFWSNKPIDGEDLVNAVTPIEVVGVVRGSEKPSIFVPANDPSSSQWFYVDVPLIACSCGLPKSTVYVEDINDNINPSNPYPVPKDANALIRSSVMPQDHLNYTLTWYTLSAAVTYMAFKRLKPTKSKR